MQSYFVSIIFEVKMKLQRDEQRRIKHSVKPNGTMVEIGRFLGSGACPVRQKLLHLGQIMN